MSVTCLRHQQDEGKVAKENRDDNCATYFGAHAGLNLTVVL